MASEVDICNVALARLGDSATVASLDPPEGSSQAEHCARFYPIARDTLLEMYQWGFATRRIILAQVETTAAGWVYAYARPTDALKLISVGPAESAIPPGYHHTATVEYAGVADYIDETDGDGNRVIFSNCPDAVMRYIYRVTDTSKFSAQFQDALAWLLASYMAGPILKGDAGMSASRTAYQAAITMGAMAARSDAMQQRCSTNYIPASIAAR